MRRWPALLGLTLWMASILAGQAVNARITGDVQDEEGRYLAGVEVTAINIANNAATTAFTSGDKGTFRFLGLAPGIYQVSFDLEGYQAYVASGISLSSDQSATLHVKLKPLPESADAPPRPRSSRPDAPPPEVPWKKWQLEIAAGVSDDEPDDLNLFISRDQALCKARALQYINAYHYFAIYIMGQAKGELKPLGGARPLTARVRFSLDRVLSLAAGISRFEQQRDSHYSITYSLTDRQVGTTDPGRIFSVSNEMPVHRLGVKGLFPHVGAQASLSPGRGVRLAAFVHAGWTFAECHYASTRRFQDGHTGEDRSYEVAMSGQGSALTLEGGAKLEFAVWRGLGFFLEGLYQSCRVKKVTGDSSSSEVIRDLDAVESSSADSRSGRWVLSGMKDPFPLIPSPEDGTAYAPFQLDLGGMGVRAGLLFRF